MHDAAVTIDPMWLDYGFLLRPLKTDDYGMLILR